MTVTDQWIHADHLGSVSAMTDDQGDLTSFKYYEPYGNLLVDEIIGTPPENRFEFTNKERDAETGLSYFEARYLSTDLGRFLSQDPWEGDYFDPQSLNKYAYARNNPITYNDPTGEKFSAFRIMRGLDAVLGAIVDLGTSFIPGVSDFRDSYEAVSGVNMVTQKPLTPQEIEFTQFAATVPIALSGVNIWLH